MPNPSSVITLLIDSFSMRLLAHLVQEDFLNKWTPGYSYLPTALYNHYRVWHRNRLSLSLSLSFTCNIFPIFKFPSSDFPTPMSASFWSFESSIRLMVFPQSWVHTLRNGSSLYWISIVMIGTTTCSFSTVFLYKFRYFLPTYLPSTSQRFCSKQLTLIGGEYMR